VHVFHGNVITDATKWGLAIHDTHFSRFSSNVVYRAGGSGILTEDGNEYGNEIVGNFIVAVYGDGIPANSAFSVVGQATEGSGIWLRGTFSSLRGNIVSNVWSVSDTSDAAMLPRPRSPSLRLDPTWGFAYSFVPINVHMPLPVPAPRSRQPRFPGPGQMDDSLGL